MFDSDGTTSSSDAEHRAAIAYLRRIVPGLPDSFGSDPAVALFDAAPHAEVQATIMAVMNLVPHVDRSAFLRTTLVGDVLAWCSPELAGAKQNMASPVTRPRGSYRTTATSLRAVTDADVDAAYLSSLDPRHTHRWRFRGQTPSPEEFRRMFFTPNVLAQLAVVPAGQPLSPAIGLVSAYNADLSSGHCRVAFQKFTHHVSQDGVAEPEESRGQMIEGFAVFTQYLFDHFMLRKLYLEIPEYNLSMFGGLASDLFKIEGELPEHYYYGDRFWSQRIYALYRDHWDEVAAPFRGLWPSSDS